MRKIIILLVFGILAASAPCWGQGNAYDQYWQRQQYLQQLEEQRRFQWQQQQQYEQQRRDELIRQRREEVIRTLENIQHQLELQRRELELRERSRSLYR